MVQTLTEDRLAGSEGVVLLKMTSYRFQLFDQDIVESSRFEGVSWLYHAAIDDRITVPSIHVTMILLR